MSCWKTARLSSLARLEGAVVELILGGVVIDRDAIVNSLEAKRKAVGNVIHKGLLRDTAEFVRKGK